MRALVGAYLLAALVAWPVLTLALASKLNGLRHGPSFRTITVTAAVLALAWPLALVGVYLVPRIGQPR